VLGGSAAGLWSSFWAHQAGLSAAAFVPRSLFCWLEGERRPDRSKPIAWSKGCSRPTPCRAETRQGKPEHPGGPGCGRRHRRGTRTCRPVPQGQPHHVAAQPVGEAVDPLVVEPVARRLLQLSAGWGGRGGQSGAPGAAPRAPLHPAVLPRPRRAGAPWARWAETVQTAGPATSPANARAGWGLPGRGGRKPAAPESPAVRGARGDARVE